MIFGGFLDTDLTNQCYIIDHNRQSIQKMKKSNRQRSGANPAEARARGRQPNNERPARNQEGNVEAGVLDSSSVRANRGNSNSRPEENEDQNNAAGGAVDTQVVMKKGKKFIKFKDYIIKLPNSMGIASKATGNFINNNALPSFVEPPAGKNDEESK